jgi:hypothetical protein
MFSLLCGLLLPAAVLFLLHNYVQPQRALTGCGFDSDSLYTVALCRNLLGATWTTTGSHLPAAPYLFPDLPLLLPWVATTSSLPLTFLGYALAFYLLLASVLARIARESGLSWLEASRLGACGVVLLLVTHLDRHYHFRAMLMAYPGNHFGAILVGFFLVALVLRHLRRPLGFWRGLAFVAAGGLGAFSDKLLIVQFLAPLGLILLALACLRVINFRKAVVVGLLLGAATASSVGVRWLFQRLGFVLLSAENDFSLARSSHSCRRFLTQFPHLLKGESVLAIALPLSLILAVVLFVVWRLHTRAARNTALLRLEPWPAPGDPAVAPATGNRAAVLTLALLAVVPLLCNLAAVLGLGLWREEGHQRYLLALFTFPLLLSPLLARLIPWRGAALTRFAAPGLIMVFALLQMGLHLPGLTGKDLRQPYPEVVRALDQLARERGIRYGLADFWLARHAQFLAHEPLHVKAVVPAGCPWLHADAPGDYLSPEFRDLALPPYQFVVFSHPDGAGSSAWKPSKECILLEYGEPAEKQVAGSCEIWVYNALQSSRLDRFLKGILAQKVRRCRSYEGPSEPRALAQPKDNLTSWNAPGNCLISDGSELEIRFTRPQTGGMLDVAADAGSAFYLSFYRGEERVGTLRVPAVPWTGAAYDVSNMGIYARLLPLPEPLRGCVWDRAVIRPLASGRKRHSVAHFLVYHDALSLPPPPPPRRLTWHRFEAEELNTFLNPETSSVADPAASGGRVRKANKAFRGVVVYGPYIGLDAGRYRADFALRVHGPVPAGKIACLMVTAAADAQLLARKELTGADLRDGDGYQVIRVPFEANAELDNVEFRVDAYGAAPVSVDYVDLTLQETTGDDSGTGPAH